jgi:hypothetical protein
LMIVHSAVWRKKNFTHHLQTLFNTCGAITNQNDQALFFSNLEGGIAEIVQYNNDNNQYTPMSISKVSIHYYCFRCSMLRGAWWCRFLMFPSVLLLLLLFS